MSTKDEIFNYVMYNPDNTNPAILKEMLDSLSGGSSSDSDLFFVKQIEASSEAKGQTRNVGGGLNYVLDKTFNEIVNATMTNKVVILIVPDFGSFGYLSGVYPVPEGELSKGNRTAIGNYQVDFLTGDGIMSYTSTEPDDPLTITIDNSNYI